MAKWALIIGGSSGMGLATAKKLALEGFNIAIVHRDRRSMLEAFDKEVNNLRNLGREIITKNLDGTSNEKISEFLDEYQVSQNHQFNLILHSISRGNLKKLKSETEPELSEQDISLTLEAMAINVISWVRALINRKLTAPQARIVTLTSAGSTKYWNGYAAVAMAKSSLEILTKYMAVELASYDLRINAINAGITDTPSLRFIPGYDELIRVAKQKNPLGRMTQPEDVANVIYLLTLPESNWINGNIIHVDGGEHLIG